MFPVAHLAGVLPGVIAAAPTAPEHRRPPFNAVTGVQATSHGGDTNKPDQCLLGSGPSGVDRPLSSAPESSIPSATNYGDGWEGAMVADTAAIGKVTVQRNSVRDYFCGGGVHLQVAGTATSPLPQATP